MLTTTTTFEGNIASDVELIYSAKGEPIVRFPVLVNLRKQDAETGEWADGEPTRHSCVAFGSLGEHLADSLGKGDRILIVGTVTTDSWADKEPATNAPCSASSSTPPARPSARPPHAY